MRTLGTSPSVPSYTILERRNSVVDGWYYPRVLGDDISGADLSGWYTQIPVYDYITLTVEGADLGDTVDIWVCLE